MDIKKRYKELNDFVGKDKVIVLRPLIEEIVQIETELEKIKNLPFIKVHEKDKSIQKRTEAGKLYLSIMAQYTQDIKTLAYIAGKNGEIEDVSPLRIYMSKINN